MVSCVYEDGIYRLATRSFARYSRCSQSSGMWWPNPFHLRDEEAHSHLQGQGTLQDPYVVEFRPNDPDNPMAFPSWRSPPGANG